MHGDSQIDWRSIASVGDEASAEALAGQDHDHVVDSDPGSAPSLGQRRSLASSRQPLLGNPRTSCE
jgi:hypothetical protein